MISDVIKIRLNEMLEKRDMTLYRLAKDTGLAYNALARIRAGKAERIYLDTLDKLCKALDCKPADLLDYEAGAGK